MNQIKGPNQRRIGNLSSKQQVMQGEVYMHDGTELKHNQVNISSGVTVLKAE